MLPLLLTIICSTSIALILKQNDVQKGTPIVLLNANYFVAFLISALFLIFESETKFSLFTFVFGMLLALIFVLSFFAFAKAVSSAGTALASLSSRLSVIVPVTFSMLFFYEIPNSYQTFGLLFALMTIIFFYFSVKNMAVGKFKSEGYVYLIAVLEKPFFLFVIFFFSFLYTLALIFSKKVKIKKPDFYRGMILGVPNVFSTFFLLSALARLPAIIVYPVVNIGIILLTTISAAIIWKEKLDSYGIGALTFGVIAIVFLGM
ncbi:hypothetical protein B6I21_02620 [candidate division KSB1 bacterium 4572_119]|nr:MAG: hypothetical protein B6I21_02620 [candidate division KSB1 bacterium 4572_119]